MQMYTGVYWSSGVGGRLNQDSLSLQHVRLQKGECLLAVVCDGIGSLQAAEDAGGIAIFHLTDWFYHEGKELICRNSSKEKILLALQGQILKIQELLRQFQHKKHIQTGTTCSALLIVQKRYYLAHIGDSRIYQLRRAKLSLFRQRYQLKCLTRDDHDENGHLYKALGLLGSDRAVLETGSLKSGSLLLLCTDGFYRYAAAGMMKRMLGSLLTMRKDQLSEQLERRLELLGRAAAANGSRDDMSAVGIVLR